MSRWEENHQYLPPKVIQYREDKNFDYAIFNKNLYRQTKQLNFSADKKIFVEILGRLAPLKKKYFRANHSTFVNKELSKAVIYYENLDLKDITDNNLWFFWK